MTDHQAITDQQTVTIHTTENHGTDHLEPTIDHMTDQRGDHGDMTDMSTDQPAMTDQKGDHGDMTDMNTDQPAMTDQRGDHGNMTDMKADQPVVTDHLQTTGD
jgi:hypothetical protein